MGGRGTLGGRWLRSLGMEMGMEMVGMWYVVFELRVGVFGVVMGWWVGGFVGVDCGERRVGEVYLGD